MNEEQRRKYNDRIAKAQGGYGRPPKRKENSSPVQSGELPLVRAVRRMGVHPEWGYRPPIPIPDGDS